MWLLLRSPRRNPKGAVMRIIESFLLSGALATGMILGAAFVPNGADAATISVAIG